MGDLNTEFIDAFNKFVNARNTNKYNIEDTHNMALHVLHISQDTIIICVTKVIDVDYMYGLRYLIDSSPINDETKKICFRYAIEKRHFEALELISKSL